jgi:flagellar basal-body rod protein FlgF
MDRLSYTSLSALRGAMARQATTANNLANAATTGFKAEMANARPLWLKGQSFESRVQSSEEVLSADMKAGSSPPPPVRKSPRASTVCSV